MTVDQVIAMFLGLLREEAREDAAIPKRPVGARHASTVLASETKLVSPHAVLPSLHPHAESRGGAKIPAPRPERSELPSPSPRVFWGRDRRPKASGWGPTEPAEASDTRPRHTPARAGGLLAVVAAASAAGLLAACAPSEAAQSPDARPESASTASASSASAESPDPGQHADTLSTTLTRPVALKYLLFTPKEYAADEARRWPLIVYLHGGSLRGTDPHRLRRLGLPALVEADSSFPFLVLSPLLPERQLWTDTDALVALIDDVSRRHRVDPARVYLTGHSVGGNGAWYLAYRHPERFAAVAPMAGPAVPWWATRLKDVPVWAFHGAADTLVPPRESREMVDAIVREGGDARLTVLEGRDHFILDVYQDRELYAWFLRHARGAPAASPP